MGRKKPQVPKIAAKATAKLEAIAKATYHRKKITTEVIPPDVTRAKVGRWLDLISPITEWAGLKGDALRHKRNLLRVQQETTLDLLAERIRQKIKVDDVAHPLPPKFVVPALEAASLEDPHSPLIEWWADLLASGARSGSTRPYLVELMKQIGSDEAVVLEKLWAAQKQGYREAHEAHFYLADIGPIIMWGAFQGHLSGSYDHRESSIVSAQVRNNFIAEVATDFLKWSEEEGTPSRIAISNPDGSVIWPSSPVLAQAGSTLDVLCALNILAYQRSNHQLKDPWGEARRYEIKTLYFTKLGIDFMNACRPMPSADQAPIT